MKNMISMALLGVFASSVLCTARPANAAAPLPDIFRSVLTEVKTKTKVPVLLPTELPFYDVKHARVRRPQRESTRSAFTSSWTKEMQASPRRSGPLIIPNTPHKNTECSRSKVGYWHHWVFQASELRGSCAPANLWWKEGSVLYQIQLKLPPGLSEQNQQRMITAAANSAILAGPR